MHKPNWYTLSYLSCFSVPNLTRQRGLRIGRDASAAVFEGDAEGMELANSLSAV